MKRIEKETSLSGFDILVLRPLFAKNSGVTVDLMDLDLDMLLKINEYLDIRDEIEKKQMDAIEKEQKIKGMRR